MKNYQMREQRAKGEEGRASSRWWGERTKGSWTSRPRRKEEAGGEGGGNGDADGELMELWVLRCLG